MKLSDNNKKKVFIIIIIIIIIILDLTESYLLNILVSFIFQLCY